MGGLCGHAGVFSTAHDISLLLHGYLHQLSAPSPSPPSFFLNSTTIATFTALQNASQSSRAYGWTINTPLVKDYGYDNSCGEMSEETFMHTGYTGTCCCVDPSTSTPMWTVILTNRWRPLLSSPLSPSLTPLRIYNCDGQLCPSGSSDAVKAIYKEFNSQARRIFYPTAAAPAP
jgi:CubicO group peptidase (beta-lactamase class C family)